MMSNTDELIYCIICHQDIGCFDDNGDRFDCRCEKWPYCPSRFGKLRKETCEKCLEHKRQKKYQDEHLNGLA